MWLGGGCGGGAGADAPADPVKTARKSYRFGRTGMDKPFAEGKKRFA